MTVGGDGGGVVSCIVYGSVCYYHQYKTNLKANGLREIQITLKYKTCLVDF